MSHFLPKADEDRSHAMSVAVFSNVHSVISCYFSCTDAVMMIMMMMMMMMMMMLSQLVMIVTLSYRIILHRKVFKKLTVSIFVCFTEAMSMNAGLPFIVSRFFYCCGALLSGCVAKPGSVS